MEERQNSCSNNSEGSPIPLFNSKQLGWETSVHQQSPRSSDELDRFMDFNAGCETEAGFVRHRERTARIVDGWMGLEM